MHLFYIRYVKQIYIIKQMIKKYRKKPVIIEAVQ